MRQSLKPFVGRIVGSKDFDDTLRTWVAEGLNARTITIRLREKHKVDVAERTVARWLSDLAPEPDRAA
jgi:hypothetical protein